jgi:hypothetical protein
MPQLYRRIKSRPLAAFGSKEAAKRGNKGLASRLEPKIAKIDCGIKAPKNASSADR